MADLLVDTDVFVDHIRGTRVLEPGEDSLFYSVVTRCELFAGPKGEELIVRELLAPFGELPVDRILAERAGRIRRENDLRIADALIAATAIEHRLTLVTRNLRHFERVPKLKVRAPESNADQTSK